MLLVQLIVVTVKVTAVSNMLQDGEIFTRAW